MHFKKPSVKRLLLLFFFVVPVAAWAIVKPVRVIAPALVGISCLNPSVCVDDSSQFEKASALYSDSLAYVSDVLSPMQRNPKFIFCATQRCADTFGLGARSAVTLGMFGTVIGPGAWRPYYVRHEMIHYLQGDQIGVLQLLLKPSWFVEGMAYSLSGDPRTPLVEPFEGYRRIFSTWYKSIDKHSVWEEARKL